MFSFLLSFPCKSFCFLNSTLSSFTCHSFVITFSFYPKSLPFSLSTPLLSTCSSLPHIKSLKCRNPVLASSPPLALHFLPLLSQTVSSHNLPPDSCCCFLWYRRKQNAASSNLSAFQNIFINNLFSVSWRCFKVYCCSLSTPLFLQRELVFVSLIQSISLPLSMFVAFFLLHTVRLLKRFTPDLPFWQLGERLREASRLLIGTYTVIALWLSLDYTNCQSFIFTLCHWMDPEVWESDPVSSLITLSGRLLSVCLLLN